MLVTGLEGINHAEHLGCIATRRGRVGQDQADGLLRVDDENTTDGEGDSLLVDVGGVLVIQHVVRQRHLSLFVANNGKAQGGLGNFVNVFDPFVVVLDVVGRQPNEFDPPFGEFGLQLGKGA